MKSLLIKDLGIVMPFLFFTALFSFLAGFSESVSLLGAVYVVMIPNMIMNQDEVTRFRLLASMMPITSTDYVLEKYVVAGIGLAIALVSMLAGDLLNCYMSYVGFDFTKLFGLGFTVAFVMVYLSILLPVTYLFTGQVARVIVSIVIMLVIGGAFVGVSVARSSLLFDLLLDLKRFMFICLGVGAVLLGISIPLSIKIYGSRDK